MHRPDIKAGLLVAGYNQTKLAQELDVSQSAVSRVIAGEFCSPPIAKRIGELLKKSPATLWPGLYPVVRSSAPRAA